MGDFFSNRFEGGRRAWGIMSNSASVVQTPTATYAVDSKDAIAEWITLLSKNKEWAEETKARDPEYFTLLSQSQSPPFLYVGCSDSRLPLVSFTKSGPGNFFVHRNVANQVLITDINFLSSLEFAVKALKVRHIIVAAHYGCGGVRASVYGTDSGIITNWVQPIRQLYLQNRTELDKLSEEELLNRMSEMSAVQQVKNLLSTSVMMETLHTAAKENGQVPTVHGVVIDLSTGIIKELPLPIDDWRKEHLVPETFDNNGYIPPKDGHPFTFNKD